MRHEVRDKNSLYFTLETILGGIGVVGLTPTCSIFSVSRQEYWDNGSASWVVGKVNNTMPPQDAVNHPGLYGLNVSNPTNMYDVGESLGGINPNISGYIIHIQEATNNIVEYMYISVSDKMSIGAVVGTVDANVVDWNGTGPTLEKGSATGFPVISVGGWRDSGTSSDFGTLLSAGDEGLNLPNINVAAWADNESGIEVSAGDETLNLPNINVAAWADNNNGIEVSTGDEGLNLPNINVAAWADNDSGIGVSSALDLPNINISDWGDTEAVLAKGGVSELPAITVKAWSDQDGGLNTSGGSIGGSAGDDVYVSWTRDTDPHGTTVDRPNVRTQIVADNAIDEDAIKIDSVTYEEISDSAVREIVNGIWGANVVVPIDGSPTLDGSDPRMAEPGTIGHAMFIDYMTRNMIHASNSMGSLDFTPAHLCSVTNPAGTKFYSQQLSTDPIDEVTQIKSYIDRTAIVIKRLDVGVGPAPGTYQHYLVRITNVATDADGQYFEVRLVDEDESPVPGGFEQMTLGSPDPASEVFDALIIKAETDPTMHEVAHEVWEESVFDHETPDTFGMFNRIMAGLSQFNHRITDSIYDDSGRLLSCRLVVYPSACDAKNGTNALTTVEVTSTYDEKQNMETFLAKEEPSEPCE